VSGSLRAFARSGIAVLAVTCTGEEVLDARSQISGARSQNVVADPLAV
jgi:hypothetical protein